MVKLRSEGSGSWLSLAKSGVGWQGLQAVPRTRQREESERANRRGERRVQGARQRRGGREKRFWRMEQCKDAGRRSRSGRPGASQALLPVFPKSRHRLKSVRVAGKGWCYAGFGKKLVAGGPPSSPAARHRGSVHLCARTGLHGHHPWGEGARGIA